MNLDQFKSAVSRAVPKGTELENPGGGMSIINSITSENICYQRGSSNITVAFSDLFDAYSHHKGKSVSCSDLKTYAPSVFDSTARPAGHSCNCTFLFVVLRELGVIQTIGGSGVRGNPYHVDIPD